MLIKNRFFWVIALSFLTGAFAYCDDNCDQTKKEYDQLKEQYSQLSNEYNLLNEKYKQADNGYLDTIKEYKQSEKEYEEMSKKYEESLEEYKRSEKAYEQMTNESQEARKKYDQMLEDYKRQRHFSMIVMGCFVLFGPILLVSICVICFWLIFTYSYKKNREKDRQAILDTIRSELNKQPTQQT